MDFSDKGKREVLMHGALIHRGVKWLVLAEWWCRFAVSAHGVTKMILFKAN